jgi:phage shock protein PspC (stress-responsive transcriptional regulator)
MKRFYRITKGDIFAGVCTGLAKYFGLDVVWIRLAFVVGTLFWGTFLLLYIIIALISPRH